MHRSRLAATLLVTVIWAIGCGDNAQPWNEENTGTPDSTPPVVLLDLPKYDVVSGARPITMLATDDVAVVRTELLVDGLKVAESNVEPFTLEWDTTAVGDGVRSVRVVAYDAAGNTGASETVPVLVVNSGEAVVFDEAPETFGFLEDTFSVPANWNGSDIDKKYHFTMPAGVTRAMALLLWDPGSGFALDYSMGTGWCPHSGKVLEERAERDGEIILYHVPGDTLAETSWFVHIGPANGDAVKGQSVQFRVRVVLFR